MYQYTNLQPQQAEHAPSISKLTRLLDVLLTISSSAQIKYKALKQSFTYLIQAWGLQLLKPHWNMEDNLLAGRAADSVGVLLKHWRRCSNSEAAWGKLVSRLDESETLALERLRKKTNEVGKQQGPKKRQLKLNHSEVSKDSKGWPNMVAQSIDSEAEDEETEQEELESEGGSPNTSDESPPPCLKKDWRSMANVAKKPAADEVAMKKPASSKSEEAKLPVTAKGPAKGLTCGTGQVLIHQETITIGGGKVQSYLQHQPGPGKNKRLIAAVTSSQASRTTKTHKQLVELLLPACKRPKATKADVLAERDKLLTKFAK